MSIFSSFFNLRLHDRTGRLEIQNKSCPCHAQLHDRTGRLEMMI